MSYQNVGVPRFYIDQAQYLKSIGFDFQKVIENSEYNDTYKDVIINGGNYVGTQYHSILSNPELFNLDPINQTLVEYLGESDGANSYHFICPTGYNSSNLEGDNIGRYFGLLNHNIETNFHFRWTRNNSARLYTEKIDILNGYPFEKGCTIYELEKTPSDDGHSFNPLNNYNLTSIIIENPEGMTLEPKLGGISWGVYYDMPNSPDLDLTLDIEFTGAKSVDTLGGSTLTNTRYTGSPWWYDVDGNKVEPWSIGETTGTSKRNGRRVWKLSFSYISDENLFASNFMSNNYLENSSDNSNYNSNDLNTDGTEFEYTLEDDNSFIAQVLNKVSNGQRFIFQPDNTNNNPDQFAICMLDMTTFSIKQVAFKTYEIEMDIREVW